MNIISSTASGTFSAAAFCIASLLLCSCAHQTGNSSNCYNNLREIDGAKEEFAVKNHLGKGAIVTTEQVRPYLLREQWPICPRSGRYVIGKIGEDPICTYPAHRKYRVSGSNE